MGDQLVPGPDGVYRCPWANGASDYARYHDEEWGTTLRGEWALFERLSLEVFQAGLAWLTILRKRSAFRHAFAGFAPERVAAFGQEDVASLLADPSIVRNRAKIRATITNARAVLGMDTSLDDLLWSLAPPPRSGRRPRTQDEVPAMTPESRGMARELKGRGFVFVGPTICYSLMQATGMVDDHVQGCFRAGMGTEGQADAAGRFC